MKLLWIVPALSLLAGCRSGEPVAFWQHAVEQYVQQAAAGDLTALASAGQSASADDLRPALAIVSTGELWATEPSPPALRDAHGVLVGLAQSAGRPWYVFAVGVCDAPRTNGQPAPVRRPIVDVRIAAVSGGPERFDWRVADPQPDALSRYLSAKSPDWPALDVRSAFPRAADDFTLNAGDTSVRVIERNSGAEWTLELSGK